MGTLWVVVGNRAHSKVYEMRGSRGPWSEVGDFSQPEARLKERELETDRPGRTFDRNAASKGRHSVSGADHRDELIDQFSRRVVHFLNHEEALGRFDHLVLVAEAKFLGALRKGLGENSRRRLVGSLEKDLVDSPPESIRERIEDLVKSAAQAEVFNH